MVTRLVAALALISLPSLVVLTEGDHVRAATLTASYEAGHLDVSINDYRTTGMGTFRLLDGGDGMPALCIEADQLHSTVDDAYREVATGTPSNQLDTLIWLITQAPPDDDTATAAAALAWFYAGARRTIGAPVWSNWALGYQPIAPLSPEPWDALAPFGLSHPVGLRVGRSDLDTAERRVAELHRRVVALAGPWRLTADPDRGGFRLVGSAGPISDQPVEVTVTAPRSAAVTTRVVTDADGYVVAPLERSTLSDGASVEASLGAPGPHREWDGEGSVQRMITSTEVRLTAGFAVAPAPRHIMVLKHSTDPTIGVAGGVFALADANGTELERIVTDVHGSATFAPVDPLAHPEPYTVSEVEPPPGLAPGPIDVILNDVSSDPDHPSIAEFTNEPLTAELVVRKELSVPVGPGDRSGFGFTIVRTLDGRSVDVTSDGDGTTAPVALPLGTYEVCETVMPIWAAELRDGGCQTVEIDLDMAQDRTRITVSYLNIVPPPSIDTEARDASDGDQVLGVGGGHVIDRVTLTGLVPGSAYTLVAELVRLDTNVSSEPGDRHSVVQTTTVDFVSDTDSAVLDVEFEIEFELARLEDATLVVTQQLLVGDTLVAVHDDLTDRDQTVTIVAPNPATTIDAPPVSATSTTTTTLATPTTTPQAGTLPRTGGDGAAQLLQLGDIGFVIGVALIALAGLLPRRHDGPI